MGRGAAFLCLVVSTAFTAVGLWGSIEETDPKWIGVVSFGLAGLAVAIGSLRDDRRGRKLRGVTAVEVPGGVPLGASPWEARATFALALLMFGVPALVFPGFPVLVGYLSFAMAAASLVGLVASFLGVLPRQTLTFTPTGLEVRLGRGRDYTIDWDDIAAVAPGRFVHNEAAFLVLVDPSRVKLGPKYTPKAFRKAIAWTRGFAECDIVLLAKHFGMTGAELAAALATYMQDPAKRSRLVPSLPR